MNKKVRSKIPLKTKAPFKWVFMDIIPSTAPKSLTRDTTFYKYLLIMPTPKFQNFMEWRNHNRRSYGQARYVPIHILEN